MTSPPSVRVYRIDGKCQTTVQDVLDTLNAWRYYIGVRRLRMIQSFRDKETQKIFEHGFSLKLPADIQRIILRKLVMIHAAKTINDLRVPPGNHLERLKGDRKNQYSVCVNQQWRICFVWIDGSAFDVEIQDYH